MKAEGRAEIRVWVTDSVKYGGMTGISATIVKVRVQGRRAANRRFEGKRKRRARRQKERVDETMQGEGLRCQSSGHARLEKQTSVSRNGSPANRTETRQSDMMMGDQAWLFHAGSR
jgi:hypothetical protein